MHVNVVGARHRGSVVLMLGHRSQWLPTLDRHRAKFNDQLNIMTPIWRRGGGRQDVYWACVVTMTTRGGVIRGSVRCLNLYE